MNCPACSAGMMPLVLDGNGGTRVDLDLCPPCQVIWFDRFESLRLAPGGTLQLFKLIGERKGASPTPLPKTMKCPRCPGLLQLTHDRQRNTKFHYFRCAKDSGRLTTFFEFLQEKDFIRPLTARQLEELRRHVQMVNCSNCGAPIELKSGKACAHCGTPVSVLDYSQIEKVAGALAKAAHKAAQIDSGRPIGLTPQQQQAVAAASRPVPDGDAGVAATVDLISAGVYLIATLLK